MASSRIGHAHIRRLVSHPLSVGVGFIIGAVCALALARGTVASIPTSTDGSAPAGADRLAATSPVLPSDRVCAEQTWPYIEKGCIGRTGAGPPKRPSRVIVPELGRGAQATGLTDAAGPLLRPEDSPRQLAPTPPQETAGLGAAPPGDDPHTPPAAEAWARPILVEPERSFRTHGTRQKTGVRSTARIQERRRVVVYAPPGRAGIVAEGPNYRVRRVYLVPRDKGVE
jgi:hypothetical protein